MSHQSEADDSSLFEKEHTPMQVTEIEPLGFGNPDAKISITERLNDPLEAEMIAAAGELILGGEKFVPVTDTDDGCIDGRIASLVRFINSENFEEQESFIADDGHERAKVAGGGYITALAMYIAAKFNTGSADGDLAAVTELLTKEGLYCGAHTGEHSDPNDHVTDCGANDKIDKILLTAVQYASNIRGTTEALLAVAGVQLDEGTVTAIDANIQKNWKTAAESDYFDGSDGDSRMLVIKQAMVDAQKTSGAEKPVAVSKDLAGSHNEAFIVVNYREGVTMSQRRLQAKLIAEYPDVDPKDLPQAFVVDAWRIVELAITLKKADPELDMTTLLYSGVAYQLATAATLTDGSLRVIIAQ